jgi:DNA-directed RNA polymerase specialized sigma subunit
MIKGSIWDFLNKNANYIKNKMKAEEMIETLNERYEELKAELLAMEKDFNIKKEQFIRIQGAIEALNELENQ